MGSINKQISRYETTAVYTHPDAKVDIVLVHGLNGGPDKTWTAKNNVFWPADLLPASLKDAHANVLVYGYNADVYSSRNDRSASDNFIFQHAQSLVTSLTLYRKSEGTFRNPIIWVAHSLGGILVKRALLYSNDVRVLNHEDYRSIFVSTFGIIFLGTPHTGSGIATWGQMLQSMSDVVMPKKLFETESVLLKTLKRDNETLQNINSHFLDVYQRFKIHMAHENHKTDVKGTKLVVVDANSASPQLPGVTYYGIEATHSGMCKFESNNAPGYRNVSTAIREWVGEAPPVIQVRWEIEEDEKTARARNEVQERLLPFTNPTSPQATDDRNNQESPTSPRGSSTTMSPIENARPESGVAGPSREPLFIHPDRFRPNSYFKGREGEMKELHKLLLDRKRRSEGTSAVLIQGIPGAGKTHLARQYVFKYREAYPGGVYWIRAKTLQDMEDGFWQIAKNEAIKELVGQEKKKDLQNPKKMVELVKNWFNDFEDWLLIFDGIHFDNPAVRDFIPDVKNSSLIYTSTERAVTGDYLYDNPGIIELELLPIREAQELLLEEMEKTRPWTTDDLGRAMELVQLMDRLPLMIHAAAQQMKATREPLAKYLKSFKEKPKVGILPAYKAVRDQLQDRGATAALNLIYLLSFFSQHIPVEMLALGMEALDKRTPIKTNVVASRKKSVNKTFAILIAFALIERNEMDDIPSASSRSSRQSIDLGTDLLDVIRMHSIVQSFFIELLVEEKQLAFWLERAISVFCRSYDEADARIKQDPKAGLPDDYRRYAIHGKKLMEHLERYGRKEKSPELAAARTELLNRMKWFPDEIDKLQRTISTNIVNGGDVPHGSIFERTNSLSTTQSTETTQSGQLSMQTGASGSASGQPGITGRNPGIMAPGVGYENPYHYHVPYPYEGTIPAPEYNDDGFPDDRTVTQNPDTAMSETGLDADHDWTTIGPSHRVVKKLETRRYHDRAGAWREIKSPTYDPRVSISREVARGYISPSRTDRGGRSPSRKRMTAGSEAELTLNQIKKMSPPPARGGGYIQDKIRSSSMGTTTRPWPVLGQSTYADVLSGSAIDDESPITPTFSNGFLKSPHVGLAITAATLQRLRENSPPSRANTIDRAIDETVSQSSIHTQEDFIDVPPTMFRGARSANSSPGMQSGPFSPPGLPMVTNTSSSLQQGPVGRREGPYQPMAPYGYDPYDDLLSQSYPVAYRPAVNVHPPGIDPWGPHVFGPDGYTSQPMSRNPSSNPQFPGATGSPHTPGSASGSGSGRGMSIPRQRRPSFVETEPSPRLAAFDIDPTSYQAWEQKHRGRARGDSLFGGSNVPATRGFSAARMPNFVAPQSPDVGSTGSPRGSPNIGTGGENMARSGSGGINVGGRIIEFGDVPVDVVEAGNRVQEDWERLGRQGGRGMSSERGKSSGSASASPPGGAKVGLGIL